MMADNEVRSARRIVLFLLEVCGVNLVSRCTRSPGLGSVLKFHVGEREKPRNHSSITYRYKAIQNSSRGE
jgi:hypothetical protein